MPPSPAEDLVLAALASLPVAWHTPLAIAGCAGLDAETATDTLADLGLSGLVEVRADDDPVTVCLSPLGAARLGLRAVEVLDADGYLWSAEPEDLAPRPTWSATGSGPAGPDDEDPGRDEPVDPGPGPAAIAEASEEVEALFLAYVADQRDRRAHDRFPWPMIVLMGSRTVWGEHPGDPNCPVCKLRPLGPITVCGRCVRWGMDQYFAAKRGRKRA